MASGTGLRYEPNIVSHPGEIVVDYLDTNAWSQRDLARRTGLTPKTISEICNGKAPITAPTALALEKVFQRPAHLWLNLQRQYDEAEARRRAKTKVNDWKKWARRFPLAEMKRFGWLNANESGDHVDQLLTFLGVSSPESWTAVWQSTGVEYRQTRSLKTSIEAISAWTRATELLAAQLQTEPFDEARLRSVIADLRRQTREPAQKSVPQVEKLCASVGIAVVWLPALSHTGISGCARWLTDRKALIGMTLRYKTDDQIWFTFFHEVAHILLHWKENNFILDNAAEDLVDNVIDPQMQKKEEEANRFAADTLIPPEKLHQFMELRDFSNEGVIKFADELEIGPGIVIGRLQREKLLAYFQGNKLKRTFEGHLANE